MNNNQKIIIAVGAAAILLVAGYFTISKNVTLDMLSERYPEIDRKIAKSVYRGMMSDAMRGKIDVSNWSEEQFNDLFLRRVANLSAT